MTVVKTFADWFHLAAKADQLEGQDLWRSLDDSAHYDSRLIKARLDSLRGLRSEEDPDVGQAMFLLRAGMIRNLGGICNAKLYRYSRIGTKTLIEEYIIETIRQLERVAVINHPEIGISTKVEFFGDLLRSYGKTALILHGGASFGLCHLGVAKSLHMEGLLPRIVCGTYIGALIAAVICVQDDEGLGKLFSGKILDIQPFQKPGGAIGSLFRKILRLARYGCLLDVRVVEEAARRNIGGLTFKEAHLVSGRILNIIVQSKRRHEVPILLNYITAPDVVVWSAACASCAVPGIYESVTLLSKCPDTGDTRPWHPSTIKMESAYVPNEIPTARLAELFNANCFIVSQVPSYFSIQISPSDEANRSSYTAKIMRLIGDEIGHRYQQAKEVGIIPKKLSYFERFFHAPQPGDITLSPTILFSDIAHIIKNPTQEFVQYCLEKGQRSVWKRMAQLKVRTAIEYGMEKIHKDLKHTQMSNSINKTMHRTSVDSVLGERPQLKYRTRSFEL